jgi:hypothetical protein
VERTYYRIVRAESATEDDFTSAAALGKPLRDQRFRRQWESGVSVYDSREYAAEQARVYRFMLGRHIVALQLPADGSIEVEQFGSDRHHYTLYSSPDQLLSLVVGEPILIDEEEHHADTL